MQAVHSDRAENRVSSVTSQKTPTHQSLWEEVPCNLCGSSSSKVNYQGTTDPDTEKLLTSYSASGNFVSKETLMDFLGWGVNISMSPYRNKLRDEPDITLLKCGYQYKN